MPRGDFDRSARRAQTRALLLQAAASVYARCGFNGATLDEVAAEAGFTKGAVYDHFGSKENLLLALMEEHLAGQVAEQIELFDRERSTWERPVAGSDRWMQRLEEDPEPFRLFVELWLYARGDERLRRGLAAGDVHDQQALIVVRPRRGSLSSEVDVEGGTEAMLNDDKQPADHVRMVRRAVVDVVAVDLHAPLIPTMVEISTVVVVAVRVRRLRERQHCDGEHHQEDQTPT